MNDVIEIKDSKLKFYCADKEDHEMIRKNPDLVLMSYPPQAIFKCKHCDYTEYRTLR